METLNNTTLISTVSATIFSFGGTLAVLKYLVHKHDIKISKIEEQQKQFVERATHDADMRAIHERITKKDDELKKSIENLEKEVTTVAREISRIIGFIEGREKV